MHFFPIVVSTVETGNVCGYSCISVQFLELNCKLFLAEKISTFLIIFNLNHAVLSPIKHINGGRLTFKTNVTNVTLSYRVLQMYHIWKEKYLQHAKLWSLMHYFQQGAVLYHCLSTRRQHQAVETLSGVVTFKNKGVKWWEHINVNK